jgi:hypothetical protein
VLEDQPHRPLADLLGKPRSACHDSILSRNGVSGKPGAVHRLIEVEGTSQPRYAALLDDVILAGTIGVSRAEKLRDGYAKDLVSFGVFSEVFGPGGDIFFTSGSGDAFGLNGLPQLGVPFGYAGGALSGSATFSGETFASIGMTPGTYVWSWGSGGSADSFTLNIVPEPTTVLLLTTRLAALAWRVRRG